MINNPIHFIKSRPEKLFILDGIGALLSFSLTAFLLPEITAITGIPNAMNTLLLPWPLLLLGLDVYFYRTEKKLLKTGLLVIPIINCVYCICSFILAGYHRYELTLIGWSYLLLEALIIGGLVYLELITLQQVQTDLED
jgi:hypothetical protein